MGRLWGGIIAVAGITLWYYGGTRGETALVNLGIGTIILGLVLATMPSRGYVDRKTLPLTCTNLCGFLENLRRELNLKEKPLVIPPYENLPEGGIFIPESENPIPRPGKFSRGRVLITGTPEESGLLLSPPPGWGIVEYALENVGELGGTGVGYASSVVSSVLSGLGIGSGEAFEGESGEVEVFVSPLCDGPFYADPIVSAMLLGVAMGRDEIMGVESAERVRGHWKIVLKPLGGIEKWL
ncbi:hypothetical protein [Thermococcus sp.]|uniref:hypothetical protein n=1 Tax=Thermococcus sp. TaxID=35749 RepID=UPI00260AF460|nr:hypothetical protein [Thermococcus sp.]